MTIVAEVHKSADDGEDNTTDDIIPADDFDLSVPIIPADDDTFSLDIPQSPPDVDSVSDDTTGFVTDTMHMMTDTSILTEWLEPTYQDGCISFIWRELVEGERGDFDFYN